ncbi:DUF4407 domain-containing protein [Terriglobus albidus]|uniref:DUF4407 domain-containing protein n=1 Tax=Terriglobus albidus TaxID=1592106 RepID=UPI0021DF6779|nr:DUF4407 domain-containing protein [Terriglobus albidus]
MRTKIITAVFAFLGLFAGAFSLWTAGNSIRYGIPLGGFWTLVTTITCPPAHWLPYATRLWPLLLLANIVLYAILGFVIGRLLPPDRTTSN